MSDVGDGVVVASANPVKLSAAQEGLERAFGRPVPVTSAPVASGVPDQPVGDAETLDGAWRRAERALRASGAELALGIEAGVAELVLPNGDDPTVGGGRVAMVAFAWVVALAADGRHGLARSAGFSLPEAVAARVRSGQELGHAVDAVFGTRDVKRGLGAVGLLSGGRIDRTALYVDAVVLALIPWSGSAGAAAGHG